MKVFILGAEGQLGSAMQWAAKSRGIDLVALGHGTADVRDEALLTNRLDEAKPGDLIVNAAAVLAAREAESDPLAQLDTNVRGAMLAALVAHRKQAVIIHFSTDYVFDGTKGSAYVESDLPNPLNMYGALKLASEILVRCANPRHYILRLSHVFGTTLNSANAKRPNLVDMMLRSGKSAKEVAVRDDVVISPTYARDAAAIALELVVRRAPFGVYHCSNGGACSPKELAQAIFDLSGIGSHATQGSPVDTVVRPKNSSLASEKLGALGIAVRQWPDALAAYLAERE